MLNDPSPDARPRFSKHWQAALACIVVLFLAIGMRAGIDLADGTYFTRSYISEHYTYFEANHLFQMRWYEYLFPNPHMKGTWSTTGFMLNYALDISLGPLWAHYFLYIASTAAFFLTVYTISRSILVATICTMFLAFSPFNLSVYIWHGSNNAYNTLLFASLTLLFATSIWRAQTVSYKLWTGYVLSLWAMALAYEIWLNFAVLVTLSWYPMRHILKLRGDTLAIRRMDQLAGIFLLSAAIYIAIRSGYLSMTTYAGSEAQMLMSKGDLAQFIDDGTHNAFFFPWMTVSQILPSFVGNSWSVLTSGGVLDVNALTSGYLQTGGWPDLNWTILAHHYTLWRFFAGMLFAILIWAVIRLYTQARGDGHMVALWASVLCLAVLLGSPSHALLQVVQFNVWPHYPYKITTSLFCLLLLIGLGFQQMRPGLARLHAGLPAIIAGVLCLYAVGNYIYAAPLHNAHIQLVWGDEGFFNRGFYPGLLGNPYHVP